jgi:hypothetical protein
MATTLNPPISERVQRPLDKIKQETENWKDEKTREVVIETQQRIARYEREHRMSSATMRRKVIAGEVDETLEMCGWAFDLDDLDGMLGELPKP